MQLFWGIGCRSRSSLGTVALDSEELVQEKVGKVFDAELRIVATVLSVYESAFSTEDNTYPGCVRYHLHEFMFRNEDKVFSSSTFS